MISSCSLVCICFIFFSCQGMEDVHYDIDGVDEKPFYPVTILVSFSGIMLCALVIMFSIIVISRINENNRKERDDFIFDGGKQIFFIAYSLSY